MADIFLIVVTVVVFVLLFISAFYILVYYQHPDDRNDAYFPKAVVVLGLVISGATVLLLPLDVANNEGFPGCEGYATAFCGGLNMDLFWSIFFWLIPIWVFFLIPFSTFYYEADDGIAMAAMVGVVAPARSKSRLTQAICSTAIVLVIMALVFLLTYLFLSYTTIPVQDYTGATAQQAKSTYGVIFNTTPSTLSNGTVLPFQTNQLADVGSKDAAMLNQMAKPVPQTMTLRVDPATFYAGFMAWMGWFFFAVFGGIGISALPLDFILSFVNRPKHMNPEEFAEAKASIQARVNEMVEIGEQLKRERDEQEKLNAGAKRSVFNAQHRKDAKTQRNCMREFKAAVYLLEQDVADFAAASSANEKYNPLLPWLSLFMGIICSFLSLFWIIHIGLYMLPPKPVVPFLNTYFQWFDIWFPLFGTLSVAIFTVYLLICALKGCFKFGLRFVCIDLHPMIVGKTYMSSFMFNLALVLLCALPVVQFCTEAFSDYARFATIQQIFGIQIENLTFFGFFWKNKVFVYAFVVIMVLTALFLWCRPRDRSKDHLALRDRLKARS